MSAMAAALPARLDSVLSFGNAVPAEDAEPDTPPAFSDAGSDDDDDSGFEFAFAPPLAAAAEIDLAPADDLFAHGRLLPAYPVFDRHLLHLDRDGDSAAAAPSPDTYCAWAPRSAPGSPTRTRERDDPFPKSASTGEARRSWRLRDLVSGGGVRSHSDGKEKFHFLQPTAAAAAASKTAGGNPSAAAQKQKQSKKKSSKAAVTEMDMATAHKLFYSKPGGGGGALAGDRRQQQQSYLPYWLGFFTAGRALGRSHHPY